MRHGEAYQKDTHPERPLNPVGRQRIHQLGRLLSRAEVPISRIYHSSVLRSQESASIMAEYLPSVAPPEYLSCLDPETDVKMLSYVLTKLEDHSLLLGHLPNMALLASQLLTGNYYQSAIEFAPASIACLSQENALWLLNWLIDPILLNKEEI